MADTRRFTMNLPGNLHKRLKLYSVQNDTEMGKVIQKLVEEFLSKEEKKLKK